MKYMEVTNNLLRLIQNLTLYHRHCGKQAIAV